MKIVHRDIFVRVLSMILRMSVLLNLRASPSKIVLKKKRAWAQHQV